MLLYVLTEQIEVKELKVAFRALADVTRLRILYELAKYEEMNVSDLARSIKLSQPLMSWHLRILRKSGLVSTHREGRQVYCALNRNRLAQCQGALNELCGETRDPLSLKDPEYRCPPSPVPL
ncbi:MAG: metalloregulator ArsR/SmtB family transcription factor [Chloroflexi bacterium]|nr:metalloregulator ArsR/SmtB family transcription factor [Chloroflexota bacterium]MCL5075143.1 metalloregulator ArsR/SmtB family transcription factor [Chloroflexota bacterium]